MSVSALDQLAAAKRADLGRSVIRAYMNIVARPRTPATVLFDATSRAGAGMDLALRIRRQGVVTAETLRTYARLANLAASDLELWWLRELERTHLIEVRRDKAGRVVEIEEQVGVAAPVLEQTAQVWENLGPTIAERCAMASADHLTFAPMAESDHRAALEIEGYRPQVQDEALIALAGVGMLHRMRSSKLREDVLFSPYVWSTQAVDIAEFMKNLPVNERQMLAGISRTVAERPGVNADELVVNQKLLRGAQKVGLFDSTRVITSTGATREFAFSPSLERALRRGPTDVTHDTKLFVAHILFGHRYGLPATGRIADPIVLVEALINRGSVGPATAISHDYPLLEAKGIVRVERVSERSTRASLRLVKEDVARDGLDLLRLALSGTEPAPGAANPLESLWMPGTAFRDPEHLRAKLPELQPGAETEVLTSTVEHLREDAARAMRRENM